MTSPGVATADLPSAATVTPLLVLIPAAAVPTAVTAPSRIMGMVCTSVQWDRPKMLMVVISGCGTMK